MARHEERPQERPPWPQLYRLGGEFMDMAVRDQIELHGPTAEWAIALDLGVGEVAVSASLCRLRAEGEVQVAKGADRRVSTRWEKTPGLRDPVDVWVFALGWLAQREFTEEYSVTCPECGGVESWSCSDCDAGKVTLGVQELIQAFADGRPGSRAPAGAMCQLAVLGDFLMGAGEPWGHWLAALLHESLEPRQQHVAAIAESVRAAQLAVVSRGGRGGKSWATMMHALDRLAAGESVRLIGQLNSAMLGLAGAAGRAARSFAGLGDELRRLGQAAEQQRAQRSSLARIFDLDLELVEAAATARGHEAVWGDLIRGELASYRAVSIAQATGEELANMLELIGFNAEHEDGVVTVAGLPSKARASRAGRGSYGAPGTRLRRRLERDRKRQ